MADRSFGQDKVAVRREDGGGGHTWRSAYCIQAEFLELMTKDSPPLPTAVSLHMSIHQHGFEYFTVSISQLRRTIVRVPLAPHKSGGNAAGTKQWRQGSYKDRKSSCVALQRYIEARRPDERNVTKRTERTHGHSTMVIPLSSGCRGDGGVLVRSQAERPRRGHFHLELVPGPETFRKALFARKPREQEMKSRVLLIMATYCSIRTTAAAYVQIDY